MRDIDRAHLHPRMRTAAELLDAAILAAGLPLRFYEGARSPDRQAELYARGRTAPGKIVTHAKPWQSFHQYGCAVDYAGWSDHDGWTWPRADDPLWLAFTKMAGNLGLRTLAFERPHVELPLAMSELRGGRLPPGADASFRLWFEAACFSWPAGAPSCLCSQP